jgi:hypothetical protein
MSGGTVKPDFCELFLPCFFAFTVSFVRPRCTLSSAPTVDFEHGGRLDDYGPEERSVVEFLYIFSVCFGMLVVGGFSVDIHVACDGRISLYPAAPFRLATLLHAWTIAQVGRGFGTADWLARSANPHNSHTSDPPARRTRRSVGTVDD